MARLKPLTYLQNSELDNPTSVANYKYYGAINPNSYTNNRVYLCILMQFRMSKTEMKHVLKVYIVTDNCMTAKP